MAFQAQGTGYGEAVSPGGFEFGRQGWVWPDPMPKGITFFLDGTALVTDQFGRPIKGSVVEDTGKREEVWFATAPPKDDEAPGARAKLAPHAKVIAALASEAINWRKLTWAGWPQLPYAELKKLGDALPMTPAAELRKIRDVALRKDALRARREADEARTAEADDEEAAE